SRWPASRARERPDRVCRRRWRPGRGTPARPRGPRRRVLLAASVHEIQLQPGRYGEGPVTPRAEQLALPALVVHLVVSLDEQRPIFQPLHGPEQLGVLDVGERPVAGRAVVATVGAEQLAGWLDYHGGGDLVAGLTEPPVLVPLDPPDEESDEVGPAHLLL